MALNSVRIFQCSKGSQLTICSGKCSNFLMSLKSSFLTTRAPLSLKYYRSRFHYLGLTYVLARQHHLRSFRVRECLLWQYKWHRPNPLTIIQSCSVLQGAWCRSYHTHEASAGHFITCHHSRRLIQWTNLEGLGTWQAWEENWDTSMPKHAHNT